MRGSSCSTEVHEPRQIVKKMLAKPQYEGVGAVVRRSIGRFELRSFDPFLLLDEFSVTSPAGFPDHPHRGFETVTYMLQGSIRHEDFGGHIGTIGEGDVQWMTAGRGIVHSEMPAAHGTQIGLQIWINLPSRFKMIEPRYQEIRSGEMPVAEKDGVRVKVIAGESMGARSKIVTGTPTMYLDVLMQAGAHWKQPIPSSFNSFVYVIEGEAKFGNSKASSVSAHHLLLLSDGDGLEVWNKSSKPNRFVLIGGEPINETSVQYGPFVMNTQAEIDQTISDYENCINGFENAAYWKSRAAVDLDD